MCVRSTDGFSPLCPRFCSAFHALWFPLAVQNNYIGIGITGLQLVYRGVAPMSVKELLWVDELSARDWHLLPGYASPQFSQLLTIKDTRGERRETIRMRPMTSLFWATQRSLELPSTPKPAR